MRKGIRLAIAAGIALGLVGCTATAPPDDGSFTLVWGKETDPSNINPLTEGSVHGFEIFTLVYEALTTPNDDLSAGPGLAESWEQLDDLTWRFKLREGVQFSNGREMTAADVAGTWEAYKEAAGLSALFPNLDVIEVIDDYTFDAKTTTAVPELPNRFEIFWVLPAEELADGSYDPEVDLLGTGPYVSGEHVDGVSWRFERNENYWQEDLPIADAIDIRFIPDDASRIAALRTGEVDMVMSSNPDVEALVAGDANIEVTVQETTDMYYLWLNPQWDQSVVLDPRVRQAIALTIDRQQIIDTALGGIGKLTAIVPSGLSDGCEADGVIGATGRDVEAAQALMDDAGVSGLDLRLSVVPAFGALRAPQIAQVIQQNLQDIGITVEVVTLEGGAWIEEVFTNGTFDATINWFTGGGTSSQLASYFDPERVGIFSKVVPVDGDYLTPLREALVLPESEERSDLLEETCDLMNEEAFFIPIATKPTVILHRSDRIEPVFPAIEPTQMTFRKIAEFTAAR